MQTNLATPAAPQPVPTLLTAPFWQGCNEGRLMLQRCEHCHKLRFYPAESCPFCGTLGGTWVAATGSGTVYSWIVVHKTPDNYWRTRVPYVSAIIELDDQPHLYMPGLLTQVAPDAVRAGMRVQAWFESGGESQALPRWRPAGAGNP
jgi:uncharacterized OB-fold protein